MQGFNFTERMRAALSLARQEAGHLENEYIGTEHLLLGLLKEGEGVGATALKNLGVSSAAVVTRMGEIIKKGRGGAPGGADIPYTSRAKKVLELAMGQARELKHTYVGTEHLLLGLIVEEKGIAAQILLDVGITLENARAEVVRLLESNPH